MTTCPASVPVTVEFWPEASSATANSVLASGAPSIGDEQVHGPPGSRQPRVRPCAWKMEAATIRMAALTSSASISATVESMVAKRDGLALAGRVGSKRRVCTMAECR